MVDSGIKLPENRIHLFDPTGLTDEKYGHHSVRARRATRSHDGSAGTNGGGGLLFAVETKADSDSGGSSPRLWKTSPPTRTKSVGSPPHKLQPNHNRSHSHSPIYQTQPMSPNSRTQAIARGRKELMEMVKNIPESCYELSLRDIVEQKPPPPPSPPMPLPPPVVDPDQEKGKEKQRKEQKKGGNKVGKSESKKNMVRSTSIDTGGFLLKTSVFPIPFRMWKKRSLKPAASFGGAAKPPLPPAAASKRSVKGLEKDWWGRKSPVSSESESGGLTSSNSESARSSSSSSSSGRSSSTSSSGRSSSTSSRQRLSNRFLPSCFSFFSDKMIKPKKYITG